LFTPIAPDDAIGLSEGRNFRHPLFEFGMSNKGWRGGLSRIG
jgi:hypothetical protein